MSKPLAAVLVCATAAAVLLLLPDRPASAGDHRLMPLAAALSFALAALIERKS